MTVIAPLGLGVGDTPELDAGDAPVVPGVVVLAVTPQALKKLMTPAAPATLPVVTRKWRRLIWRRYR
jgi:hypothetical protein